MKKLLLAILALSLPTWAQFISSDGAPVTLTMHATTVDGYNETSKSILFVAVRYTASGHPAGRSTMQTHDYYMKPEVLPGSVFEMVHDIPDEQGTIQKCWLVWVQFSDGTAWGDKSAEPHIDEVLSYRAPMLAFYQRVLSGGISVVQAAAVRANNNGTMMDKVGWDVMQPLYANRLLRTYQTAGADAMMQKVSDCVANAQKHSN